MNLRVPFLALVMATSMSCAPEENGDQFGSGPNPTPTSTGDASSGGGSSGDGGSGGPACGNGTVEGGEECDGSDLAGESCMTLGYESGELTCDDMTCMFDSSLCMGNGSGGSTSG